MDDVKIKLAAAWIAAMFGYIYGDILGFYVPGSIEDILSGDAFVGTEATLIAAAVLMSLPGLMVFLSVSLNRKVSRPLNITMGILHVIIMLTTFFVPPFNAYYFFLGGVEISYNLIIVWIAWKWNESKQ